MVNGGLAILAIVAPRLGCSVCVCVHILHVSCMPDVGKCEALVEINHCIPMYSTSHILCYILF